MGKVILIQYIGSLRRHNLIVTVPLSTNPILQSGHAVHAVILIITISGNIYIVLAFIVLSHFQILSTLFL